MANIDDVAKLARVSTATVSAVVNGRDGKVMPRTRQRVLNAIEKLGYRPNLYARTLARGRSRLLGVIISDVMNPFFAEVAQVVQSEALACGYNVLIAATQFSVHRLNDAVEHMIGMRVDGMVVITTEMDEHTLAVVRRRKIPVVFEDVGTTDETTSNLRVDYAGGIYRAVLCLAELGHTHILFAENYPSITEKRRLFSIQARSDAFAAAVKKFSNLKSFTIARPGPPFQAGIEAAVSARSHFDFTGVVANCDPIAIGMLRGFRRSGKRVPQDISLIGFDNSAWCELTEPPLTSVDVSRSSIGTAAVEALVGMIENKTPGTDIRIETNLILRESVGRAPKESRVSSNAAVELRP
ncbi:MAG: LacI family DNA-binding transcriptional regulator [Acidobacteriaceae bacterium]|nr:LacI family DNA-binding transcriptional regulator [Acidobacteriaceae bacterium]